MPPKDKINPLEISVASVEGRRIFITGLPSHATEPDLQDHFGKYGVIDNIYLLRNMDATSTGRCFVTYRRKSSVDASLKFDGSTYKGLRIRVRLAEAKSDSKPSTVLAYAEGRRVFVSGIDFEVTEENLKTYFGRCGVIEDLALIRDQAGQSKGRCFISFGDKAAVEAALKHDNTHYAGRIISVRTAIENWQDALARDPAKNGNHQIYVGGVPWHLEESDLKNDFEKCGPVNNLHLVRDQDGRSKGCCFVCYRDKAGLDAALKWDQTEYAGRTITVRMAKQHKQAGAPSNGCKDSLNIPLDDSSQKMIPVTENVGHEASEGHELFRSDSQGTNWDPEMGQLWKRKTEYVEHAKRPRDEASDTPEPPVSRSQVVSENSDTLQVTTTATQGQENRRRRRKIDLSRASGRRLRRLTSPANEGHGNIKIDGACGGLLFCERERSSHGCLPSVEFTTVRPKHAARKQCDEQTERERSADRDGDLMRSRDKLRAHQSTFENHWWAIHSSQVHREAEHHAFVPGYHENALDDAEYGIAYDLVVQPLRDRILTVVTTLLGVLLFMFMLFGLKRRCLFQTLLGGSRTPLMRT